MQKLFKVFNHATAVPTWGAASALNFSLGANVLGSLSLAAGCFSLAAYAYNKADNPPELNNS